MMELKGRAALAAKNEETEKKIIEAIDAMGNAVETLQQLFPTMPIPKFVDALHALLTDKIDPYRKSTRRRPYKRVSKIHIRNSKEVFDRVGVVLVRQRSKRKLRFQDSWRSHEISPNSDRSKP